MAKEKDLLTRIYDAITSLFGDENGRREHSEEQEHTATSLAEFIELGREAIILGRLQPKPGRDLATAPGRRIEISVKIDARLGSVNSVASVGFLLDDQPIGKAAIEPDKVAYLVYRPQTAGLYAVDYQLFDKDGQVLPYQPLARRPQLLVLAGQPAVIVETKNLVKTEDENAAIAQIQRLSPLRELARRGWAVIYIDYEEKDRAPEIDGLLKAGLLPPGPILTHPSSELEFKTLGVDFRRLLAVTACRKLRSAGLHLAALIAAEENNAATTLDNELPIINIGNLADFVANTAGLAAAEQAAAQYYKRFAETEDRLGLTLDILTGTTPTEGNLCRVVFDNGAARRRIFEIVALAQSSLKLQFYIFKECRFTEHLAVHLINAARRGVKVKLLVDALYSTQELFGLKNKIVEGLKKIDNIEIVAINPIRAGDELEATRFKQRDHRKFVIADGSLAVVSGRNAGDEYYTGFDEAPIADWTQDERIPWQDAHIEVEGPLVREICEHFDQAWLDNGGAPQATAPTSWSAPLTGGCRARLVVHRGIADSNSLGAYEAIIEDAREHIYVLNDFPVVTSLAAALSRAVARGVEVFFITGCAVARRADGSLFKGSLHRELFEYMTKARFEHLITKGVKVYEFATPQLLNIVTVDSHIRPYIHGKVVTADGLVTSVGSANLDATASYWEDEILVVVEDRQLTGQVESELGEMVQRSHLIDITDESWKKESARREIVSRLWPDSLF